jgi:hypothetical protein
MLEAMRAIGEKVSVHCHAENRQLLKSGAN